MTLGFLHILASKLELLPENVGFGILRLKFPDKNPTNTTGC